MNEAYPTETTTGQQATSTGRRGYVAIDRRWLADPELSDSALRLMLWLDSHSDEYLSSLNVSRTAEELGWSRNRVKRSVSDLEALGLLSTEQVFHAGSGSRTRFTLHLSRWTTPGPQRTTPLVHDGPQGVVHDGSPTNSISIGRNEPLGTLVVASQTTPEFDTWYALFPKKQGKAEARKRWAKLSADDRRSALAALPAWQDFVRDHPQGATFVPMASTWLNQRRWEDEAPVAADERKAAPGMAAVRRGVARGRAVKLDKTMIGGR